VVVSLVNWWTGTPISPPTLFISSESSV
jgi:hypothetical protein